MVKLFVYGSLRKGCGLHYLIEDNSKSYGISKLYGFELYTKNYIYPSCIIKEGSYIIGETYDVSDEVIEELDLIELSSDFKKIIYNGMVMYIFDVDQITNDHIKVHNGDWVEYIKVLK